MFAIIWSYVVDPDWQAEFEQAYGSNGDWVEFFRNGRGYLRTELLRDTNTENHYTSIDYWATEEDYRAFHDQFAVEYQALDARFEAWTIKETLVGRFEIV